MSSTELLPVIGYPVDAVEFPTDRLKSEIEVNGRVVTAQRMTVMAPDINTGEQIRVEVVVPTWMCYRQAKDRFIAQQHERAAETVTDTTEAEVTGDADEGGDMVRRSDGRAESPSAGEDQ